MSEKQKLKLKTAGVTIQDYLAGNGPDLTDEYDDEEGEEDLDGDDDAEEDGEANGEAGDGEKRAKQE